MAHLADTQLHPTLEVDADVAAVTNNVGTEYILTHATTPARSMAFTPATEVSIGRDYSTCTVSFPEVAALSRRHCRVFSLGRDVFVQDLSSNGTFLNGKLVGKNNQKVLRTGDVVAVLNPKLPDYNNFCWRFVAPVAEDDGKDDGGVTALYDLGPVLGTGNFAAVRKGRHRKTGEEVAVKIVEKKRFAMQSDFSFASLQSEVEILRKMSHPNIIRVLDVFDTSAAFTMVLELVAGGDLFDYIVGRCPNPFTEADAKVLFVQLVEALLYMHSKDVVHRDLKPENILVHVNPAFVIPHKHSDAQKNAPMIPVSQVTLKVTDFGLAKFCTEQDVMSTMCGTPAYLAPEVRVAGPHGKAAGYSWTVDVWSLGVILYILLSGTPPKAPESGKVDFSRHFTGVSAEAQELIQWMLNVDPRLRADLKDIAEHRWLAGCVIKGKELAAAHPKLKLEGTMLLQPTPTVKVALPEDPGAATEGEESDTEPAPPSPGKRPRDGDGLQRAVVWQWKADLSKPDSDAGAWQSYATTDSEAIEKAQLRGVKTCKIGTGEYRVSFEGMFQYNIHDTSRQRPVRRVLEVKNSS